MSFKKELKVLLKALEDKDFNPSENIKSPLIKQLQVSLYNIIKKIEKQNINNKSLYEYITDITYILKLIINSNNDHAHKLLSEISKNAKLELKTSKLTNHFTDSLKYGSIYNEIENIIFIVSLIINKSEKEEK